MDMRTHVDIDMQFIKDELDNGLVCTRIFGVESKEQIRSSRDIGSLEFNELINKLGTKNLLESSSRESARVKDERGQSNKLGIKKIHNQA